MRKWLMFAPALLALAAPAAAQDFGQRWLDRVTRELLPDRGPLPTRSPRHELYLGAIAYYDDNVFLRGKDEEEETVVAPFIRLRVEYSERQLDAAADLLASYKRYIPDEEFSDHEQRAFARIRYVSPRVGLEIAEILQNVSDPIDAVFADRVERLVSNTFPRASVELSNVLALEVAANVGYVRFWEEKYEVLDNLNVRSDFSVVGHLSNLMDILAQAGVILIRFSDRAAPPDSEGFYARGGIRGELTPVINVSLLAGWFVAESDDFASGADGVEEDGADAALNVQWQLAPKTTMWADFTRQLAWGPNPEPFQTINRATLILESTLTEEIRGRLRGQYEIADGSLGSRRTLWSFSASALYKLQAQSYLEAGVTYRAGDVEDLPGTADYDYGNTIYHVGIVLTN